MRRVTLHIDRVVLAGVQGVDAQALAGGLAEELERRLAEPHVLQQWATQGGAVRLAGGRLDLASGLPSAELGRRMARAVMAAKALP